jgi:hypothetical protein
VLVAAIVSCAWVALGVLVGHWGSQCVEDGAGCDVLGGDEDDGLALSLDLSLLQKRMSYYRRMSLHIDPTYHDSSDLWIGLQQGLLEHLDIP